MLSDWVSHCVVVSKIISRSWDFLHFMLPSLLFIPTFLVIPG